MPFEVVADKIERIAPEYQGELMQFIVFLLFRQNEVQPSSPSSLANERKPRRHAGGLSGTFHMAEDFDEPLEEFAEYM